MLQPAGQKCLSLIFARLPRPGTVKTRLIRPDGLDPAGAAAVATAMLRCTIRRHADRGEVCLAATPDGSGALVAAELGLPETPTIDQGKGDLGDRLAHAWQAIRPDGPIAFFGVDSPDVPGSVLDKIDAALQTHDAAIGPTHDGGYWTLAANRYLPTLLDRVDWGSERVYDQTLRRAEAAGIRLATLSTWHDVDHPEDLDALRGRLAQVVPPGGSTNEPLAELASRLEQICGRPGPSSL